MKTHPYFFIILLVSVFSISAVQQVPRKNFFLKADAWQRTKKIKLDAPELDGFIKKNPKQPVEKGQPITLQTSSEVNVPALFFDRGSKKVLIVGQGIRGSKEAMSVYAELFDDYDVILFDYRWNNRYESSLIKSIVKCCPTQRILLDEEEEVRAVIDFVQQHKQYTNVVGLGVCYSTFLFAKIQTDEFQKTGNGPFTHLIFDSCWHSYKSFAQSISRDPFLPISPRFGGAPWIIKKITSFPLINWPVTKILFTFLQNVSIEKYLSQLNIPVLFIHGNKDLFVTRNHFRSIWKSCPVNMRAALLTPYPHSDNLGNKPLYRLVCEQFVDSDSVDDFLKNCNGLFE